jgi:hypothetical protein
MPQMGKLSVMNPYRGFTAQGRPEIVSATAICDAKHQGNRQC